MGDSNCACRQDASVVPLLCPYVLRARPESAALCLR